MTTPGSSSPRARPAQPKGVAVTHRTAAAFVDAEARVLWTRRPRRPGAGRPVGRLRRLLRGDVAGLAPRRGAGTGPALAGPRGRRPRPLAGRAARSPWSPPCPRWPRCGRQTLGDVRLLILGGEACPPELAGGWRRAARSGTPTARPRPPWSHCARAADRASPVTIGWPLDGWDLAVVDEAGEPVALRRARRAGHRRRRPCPLPGPGARRRALRPAAVARLGARLPQRRPGARDVEGLSSSAEPTSRSSSAAAASSSARSTRS